MSYHAVRFVVSHGTLYFLPSKTHFRIAFFSQQIKRKLEDVSKKLEVLYDCLRENKVSQLCDMIVYIFRNHIRIFQLSQNTLQGLHQISQMIQNGNYTGGLDLHTQLVSGPDFSQIASFMPGIKVLLLSALQLNVYIR